MAPTRPSIMSDGATMSAPASAWISACSTRSFTVSSLTMRPSFEQAVMAVIGERIERDIDHDADLRRGVLHRAHGGADEAVRIERFACRAHLSLRASMCGNTAIAGMPSFCACSAARAASPTKPSDARHRRHRDARFAPSCTTIAQIRSDVDAAFPHEARIHGFARRRRARRAETKRMEEGLANSVSRGGSKPEYERDDSPVASRSLIQHGMSLTGGPCFQRGMSLKRGSWIDHREHGDRYQPRPAGNVAAVAAVCRRDDGGRVSAMRQGRGSLPAYRRRAAPVWLRLAQAGGQGAGRALSDAYYRLLASAVGAVAQARPCRAAEERLSRADELCPPLHRRGRGACWRPPTRCTARSRARRPGT